MEDKWFRTLDKDEEKEFRQWARDNYKVDSPISSIWHPIVRDECRKMTMEAHPDIFKYI